MAAKYQVRSRLGDSVPVTVGCPVSWPPPIHQFRGWETWFWGGWGMVPVLFVFFWAVRVEWGGERKPVFICFVLGKEQTDATKQPLKQRVFSNIRWIWANLLSRWVGTWIDHKARATCFTQRKKQSMYSKVIQNIVSYGSKSSKYQSRRKILHRLDISPESLWVESPNMADHGNTTMSQLNDLWPPSPLSKMQES